MKDFLLLYSETYVIHLIDVSDKLGNTCFNHNELDLGGLYISPGLVRNAMLKKTGISLELIFDHSVLEFFESQMRG